MSGSRPVSEVSPISAIPRQFSGTGAPRTSSPLTRQPYNAPVLSSQSTGATNDWVVPASEKAQYDAQFSRLDAGRSGFVSGEQAVGFFSNSRLSENDLAQIWDLADISQTGQLNQDEFAVAMHLIRQQLNSKGPLPATLPQNLIPPSMRQQVSTPQAPPPQTAPPTAPPPKPKSAADDLFGLDALTAPAPQAPQSTGGSSSATGPSAPMSTSTPPPQPPSTHFKPFVPSSSFGQSIVTPQPTGATTSSPPSQQSRAPFDDDLLGDADPEVSKKLTNETTELANLSNQVNSLTSQMKEVQTKQVASKQELSQVANQKKDFETQLSQLRSAYEQEARELKSLQDRLTVARSDTTKLQQDFALTQHSYQNLQEQKQQVMVGLEADQKENASLKERIAQVYKETNQIKPQIDKMRSEARQQKGLVAINKKQLSTAEAEREKVKTDLDGAKSEYNEATKELEDSNRSLEASQTTLQPSTVASPAPSTSNMNPFFRRTTSMTSDKAMAPSPFASQPISSPNHSAFDSFFGSAVENTRPFTPSSETKPSDAPRTPQQSLEGQSSSEQTAYTPKSEDSPRFPSANQPPPPPPHSRQMTPSALPLRESMQRAPSSTSSVGVIPPASQFGDLSEAATPTKDKEAEAPLHDTSSDSSSHRPTDQTESVTSRELHAPPVTTPHEPPSAPPNIPGAFPTDITPVETPISATQKEGSGYLYSNDSKGIPSQDNKEGKDAFDAAFSGFEGKGKAPITSNAFGGPKPSNVAEFPPIQEFGDDNESDSDDEDGQQKFKNNFPSLAAISEGKSETAPVSSGAEQAKPSLSREISSSSQLPTPGAQKSPPTYGETMSSSDKDGAPRDANKFAAEYTGLLPSREDPTASSNLHGTEGKPSSPSGNENFALTSVTAVDHPPSIQEQLPPPVPSKTALDDFDSAFGDLSEAQNADDKGDEDFGSSTREGFDDFNPTFDSPTPSQAHSKAPTLDHSGFQDFENSLSAPSQSISASAAGAPTRAGPTKDEWDAMFAGFGSDDASASQTNGDGAQKSDSFLDVFSVPPESSTAAGSAQQSQTLAPPGKPPLNRGISASTEHDDPFVKQLTGMGYSRDASVKALEKYDYNLDKVCL